MAQRRDLLNCGNCEFGQRRHGGGSPEETEAAEARAAFAGHPVPPIHCLRHPVPIAKRPEDACGDHSELMALRDLALADMVAIAVVKQMQEPTAREAVLDALRRKHGG